MASQSSRTSRSGRHIVGAPLHFDPSSHSRSDSDSESSPSGSDMEEAALDRLVMDIDLFIQALDKATSLRISAQQRHKALIRSRENVFKTNEALADILRKSRVEGAILDQDSVISLSDASLQARDELGPLEDDFEKIEFQLVPRDDDLTERGGELKRRIEQLARSVHKTAELDRHSKPPSDHSSATRHAETVPLALSHNSEAEPEMAGPYGEQHLANLGGSTPQGKRLSKHSLHQLSESTGVFKPFRVYMSSTQSEPLIEQYAPDLFPGRSWKSWTQFSDELDDEPSPQLVDENDLSGVETTKTDIPVEGNILLLGNNAIARCPFLQELATEEYTPHSRRVSFWLLCRLRRSRLEVLRLRDIIDGKAKREWTWSDILRFWGVDDAAMSTTPPESLNVYNTNFPENSWAYQLSSRYPNSEPSFGRPLAVRIHGTSSNLRSKGLGKEAAERQINRRTRVHRATGSDVTSSD
jgi:hypothetical protein